MTGKKIKLDHSFDSRKIYELVDQGCILICPECASELQVALDLATAKEKTVPVGINCPNDESHFGLLIETDEQYGEVWRRFEERKKKTQLEIK